MDLNPPIATPRLRRLRLEAEGLGIALAVFTFGIALLAPIAAYFVALLAIFSCVRSQSRFSALAVVAFAFAGSIVFASRNFVDGAVDFDNYYSVFNAVCSHAPAEDGLLAFGPEIGLPALYGLLSLLGACHLSIAGLAFVQCLLVSALLLGLVVKVAEERIAPRYRAEVVVGMCVMFSFFFITQLSRQALSSVFLLYALMLAKSRRRVLLALGVASVCHLTAPLLYFAALLMRRFTRAAIPLALVLALVALGSLDRLVALVLNSDVVGSLDKLQYFVQLQDSAQGAASDQLTVAYLLVAALAFLLAKRRSAADSADMRMLFGLALMSAALVPLPLAATRFALPFGSLVVGYYVFAGLSAWRPAVARLLLVALIGARGFSLSAVDEGADHALWTNHASWSLVPGYFLPTYGRHP